MRKKNGRVRKRYESDKGKEKRRCGINVRRNSFLVEF
jgi:hypothetical protein